MSNLASSLPEAYHNERHGYGRDHVYPVTVGQDYVVFAMTTYLGGMWLYIADDQFSYYPVWRPAPLFEIVDGRISKTWSVGVQGRQQWVLAYREWAENPRYYERLVDQDEATVRSFALHKKLLEEEFESVHDAERLRQGHVRLNQLDRLAAGGIPVTWATVLAGFTGGGSIPPILSGGDVIAYAEQRTNDMTVDSPQLDVLLAGSYDDEAMVDALRRTVELAGSLDLGRELRKWRLLLVEDRIADLPRDPIDALMGLTEFWASLGYPPDSPHVVQGRGNSIGPTEYYTTATLEEDLARHRDWIRTELYDLRGARPDMGELTEPPAFRIGDSDSDHLWIVVVSRPSAREDEIEPPMPECGVSVRSGGTSTEFRAWLPARSFVKLRDDLTVLDRAFAPGIVEFDPGLEQSIVFMVRVGATGPIEVAGVAIDGLGSGWEQRLEFRFLVSDSLRAILASAQAVVDSLTPSSSTGP